HTHTCTHIYIHKVSQEDLEELMAEIDDDESGTMDFHEFLEVCVCVCMCVY
ncbi:unnamed protein product, partial [marine sediment metagenome]